MNNRGGWALIKSTWASWLQYRSFFFVLAFGWMIPPLIYLFVWSTAAGQETIGGLNRGEFVTYYLVLILTNQLTYSQTNWTLGDVIRTGGLNFWLLKPLPALYQVLASEIAGKVVTMVFVVPISLLLALLLHPQLNTTPENVLLFFPALILAWALRFFWGYGLALLAFWTSRADSLLSLQDSLVFLLSGMVAPVPLLPGPLQNAALLLPFRYMVGFPIEVLTGHLAASQILYGFSCQLGWLSLAVILSRLVWRSGLRRYSAIGG
jgi:ABC-2 type transport system permease protein